jgi:type III secretory pathway lipoprotein EscJ
MADLSSTSKSLSGSVTTFATLRMPLPKISGRKATSSSISVFVAHNTSWDDELESTSVEFNRVITSLE